MTVQRGASRLILTGGLFVFAVVWVVLMGLATRLFGGGRSVEGVKPTDDGTIKASLTVDRDKDFEIFLSANVTRPDGSVYEGLNEENFEVYEDGERVAIRNFQPAGKGAIRLALVIDYSSSMRGTKLNEARQAARALIRLLRDQHDWVGLYFFNDPLYDTNRSERLAIKPLDLLRREEAWEAIMFTNLGDGSPMLGTMERGLDGLAKVSGRRVMIVLSDGMDTGEPAEIDALKKRVLEKAEQLRVPIYMVNTSTDVEGERLMQELASVTKGRYQRVSEPQKLREIFEEIGRSLQNEYTMSYTSPDPVENGTTRTVTLWVRSGNVGTEATGQYTVPGVLATGARSKAGLASTTSSGIGLGTLLTVFLTVAAVLGLLAVVPLIWQRGPIALAEDDRKAASAPVTTPAGAAPVKPMAPPAAGQPRPAASVQAKRPPSP
ncbi:MAG: VWA domain-containing protein [Gemmataceae bacterium]|nr:VWA domain-containing protein [Gemmataceae bacterium]MDW8266037.1 VWA domain-containing protein [Gemmataceae bacterium]